MEMSTGVSLLRTAQSLLTGRSILEEYVRDRKDSKMLAYITFLDAKSAFDFVSHPSLMRKLFHIGIEGNLWTLISSLQQDAKSAVKWQRHISEK